MKFKAKLIVLFAAISVMVVLFALYQREHQERLRIQKNQNVLLQKELTTYKTRDSLNAVSIGQLTLTKNELKEHRDSLVAEVENLGIKLKRVNSITKTETKVVTEFVTDVKDSLVFRDRVDTLKCIEYRDDFTLISGCFDNGSLHGRLEVKVPLTQIVHRIPKKFLFFKFGTKGIRQEIYSNNPNAVIEYAEEINLK